MFTHIMRTNTYRVYHKSLRKFPVFRNLDVNQYELTVNLYFVENFADLFRFLLFGKKHFFSLTPCVYIQHSNVFGYLAL